MPITLTRDILRRIFPAAPQSIIDAYVAKPGVLASAGLTTVDRLAYCFANIHAETSGYTIRGLTENINYTAERMAAVWPNRYVNAAAVRDIKPVPAAAPFC